jgi:hypothetical protein
VKLSIKELWFALSVESTIATTIFLIAIRSSLLKLPRMLQLGLSINENALFACIISRGDLSLYCKARGWEVVIRKALFMPRWPTSCTAAAINALNLARRGNFTWEAEVRMPVCKIVYKKC